MADLRRMLQADLDQVNLLLSKSFTLARTKEEGQATRIPLCRKSFIEMYRAANPQGAFVAEKSGRIVAFCFSRLWGSVGWLGPLGVLPAEQGKGLGKQIVAAAVESLQAGGATTIGLELAAQSTYNLAFYSRMGFVPQQPTVDMIRRTEVGNQNVMPGDIRVLRYGALSRTQKPRFLTRIAKVAEELESGLDYRAEIQLGWKFQFGDAILFLKDETVMAFVFAHTENYSVEEERRFLKVNVLQIVPGREPDMLPIVLAGIVNWAGAEKLPRLYLRMPTRYHKAYAFALREGFKIVRNELRMTLDGFCQTDSTEHVNSSKWE